MNGKKVKRKPLPLIPSHALYCSTVDTPPFFLLRDFCCSFDFAVMRPTLKHFFLEEEGGRRESQVYWREATHVTWRSSIVVPGYSTWLVVVVAVTDFYFDTRGEESTVQYISYLERGGECHSVCTKLYFFFLLRLDGMSTYKPQRGKPFHNGFFKEFAAIILTFSHIPLYR